MIDILMFHRVLPGKEINKLDAYFIRGTLISQERLENIIRRYLEENYIFKRVMDIDKDGKQNQVVLTFDDGYTDNYLYVRPILEKYGVKATFYPVIGYCKEQKKAPLDYYYNYVNNNIQESDKQNWIVGSEKKRFLELSTKHQKIFLKSLSNDIFLETEVSYMTIKELKDLKNLGHEIGGHSVYHDIYTKLKGKEVLEDIIKTKSELFKIGISISSYAYTDGQYDLNIIELLKSQKIKYACAIKSQKEQRDENYELERKFVTEYEII